MKFPVFSLLTGNLGLPETSSLLTASSSDESGSRRRATACSSSSPASSRRFLLYQYRAADAWPLLGLKEGIEKFNEQLIVGEPRLAPRLVPLPVRVAPRFG
jgi:hypothetical protein